ncbi:DUF1990 domain-containing protein [Streptomyces sp. HNM0574]|uniref:DUF1990 family protein n=1 Tax=Streptomyces sp. HNM0574 TaxID=2714954 RepID=UPI00146A8CE9|nr:DUF1990 domain-containing protein [Streptomyces sp. HNM0574]
MTDDCRAGAPGFTYRPVGATGEPGAWPPERLRRAGFRTLRYGAELGHGRAAFDAASAALLEWRAHREMGVAVRTAARRARPGAQVTVRLGVGRLRVPGPCRVVWSEERATAAGWAYGTLPGHPVAGEEAFRVTLGADGTVRLTVQAFSRPVTWWTRAAGPLLPAFQRAYAWWCGRALRRIVRRETGSAEGRFRLVRRAAESRQSDKTSLNPSVTERS